MKVLFIQDVGDVGGATNSLKELIKKLHDKYNVEPIVLTSEYNSVNIYCKKNNFENYAINHRQTIIPSSKNKFKNYLKHRLSTVLYLRNYFFNLIAVKKIKNKINFNEIDLIHTNVNRDSIGFMIAKKYHIKHIVHLREFGDLDYNCFSLKRNYVSYMNKYCDKYIAISNVIKDHWIKKGLDKNKIEVIYNGVDYMNIEKCNDFDTTKKIHCVFSGQISENKGQIQVIKALSLIDKTYRDRIKLDIYGTGDKAYVMYLKKIVEKNNLDKIVEFKGFNTNLRSELRNYDVGLVCSKSEAFGRVTVEYMISKILVIATNCGANVELIEDDKTGILFEYNNIQELSRVIMDVILNYKNKQEIIDLAYEMAMKKYTSDTNSKMIYNLYERVKKDERNDA